MLLLEHVWAGAAVGALLGRLALGQTFEAASVKPVPPAGGRFSMSGGPGTNDPGRIRYTNVPLRIVLLRAYDVKNYQLLSPDWLNTLCFDITAKIPEGTTKEQFQSMLRSLLETRFRMTLHRESKELPIYELLVAKKGPRIKAVTAQSTDEQLATALPGEGPDGFPKLSMPSSGVIIETKNGAARITANEVTLAKFAESLTGRAGRPVIDRTGLAGTYSFVVYFTPEVANASDSSEPDLFAALQEQLGLRLEPGKGPVELLVIDHAEKIPTEN
ncbi:MAG: TIGR03435 family protein [Bryobacteraceae bacterium]